MRAFIAAMVLIAAALPAAADGPFPPIGNQATITECSECHLLFRPQMLPAKSWRAIIDGLDNHFGEDASLAEPVRREILAYHLAHASDVDPHRRARKFLAGVDLSNPPIRVSETPRFIRKHDDVPPAAFSQKAVGSKANCAACHTKALEGNFDDDFVVVPGYLNLFGVSIPKFWDSEGE